MASNVPFIGPRARYSVLNVNSVWNIQEMDGVDFDGKLPADGASLLLDPAIVKAGHAEWNLLKEGGKFNFLDRRHSVVVEKWFEVTPGTVAITKKILRADGSLEDFPASGPFTIGSGDCIVITSINTGGAEKPRFGILVRIEGAEIL